ncbi:MAG: response regulator [Gloeocapsa sp. UFS-A4-WI-NPMV-4B04]|jgi:PAS domain S-box-containing protein|nr:response regulator [Gloeocapsa sp. UFS-A4-WI-NPMV-4B04]
MNNHIERQKANILVVDDKPDNLRLLSAMLAQLGYEVRKVINGQTALKTAQAAPPDLILLDIMMPDMNGYEVCQHLKASVQTRDVPVIFISALDEVLDKVKAFAVGGVDYITKPFSEEEVFARVENNLTIRRLQKRLGEQNARLQQEICYRQKAEEKLIQSEAKFRNLFENSPVGIFRAHIADGLLVEANQRLIQMLGYSYAADVINQTIADLSIALDAQHLMLTELQTKGEVNNLETQFRKQDGTPIRVMISARMNAEEDCLQAVVIDIARSL